MTSAVLTRQMLTNLRNLVDKVFSSGASSTSQPEDVIVFPMLVSCRDLLEEILLLTSQGLGRAALRSVRTMYECLVIAHYIHLHPERRNDFLDQFHVQWGKIMNTIPEEYRSAEIDGVIKANVKKYSEGKPISNGDLNWSGSHTFGMAKEAGAIVNLHSIAFDYASALIHPSAFLLINTISESSEGDFLKLGERSQQLESTMAIRTAHDLMLNAVHLRAKYVSSVATNEHFELCRSEFSVTWGFEPNL